MSDFLVSEKIAEAKKETWSLLTLEWPPYTCSDCPGQGIAASALKKALEKENIRVKFTFLSWSDAIEKSRDKKHVGFFPAYISEQPNDYVLSDPLFQSPLGFVRSKGKDLKWTVLADLKGLRLGGAKGYRYPQEFFDLSKAGHFRLELVVSDDTNLRKLASGDIDLAIFDLVNARYLLNRSPAFLQSKLVVDPKVYTQMDLYVAFNPKNRELKSVLRKALKSFDFQSEISSEVTKLGLSTQ